MQECIGIAVACQAEGMRDLNTAQDEFSTGDQRVHIVANSNMNHRDRVGVSGGLSKPEKERSREGLNFPSCNPLNNGIGS